jgi:hypothetical protein
MRSNFARIFSGSMDITICIKPALSNAPQSIYTLITRQSGTYGNLLS